MASPSFDLTKFYSLRCTASQFAGIVRTLRRIDLVMKARLKAHRNGTLALLGAVFALAITIALAPPFNGMAALGLSATGIAIVYVLGALRMLFMRGKPPIARPLLVFGLVNPGIFIYMGAYAMLGSSGTGLDFRRDPTSCVAALALSTLTLVFVLRLTSGMRWKQMAPQEVELDYVERIVRPILGDLPKGTRGDVLFNPFPGEWSRVVVEPRTRPGYTYEAFADVLLRMRVPLDAERTLKLSIEEHTVSKTKDRKSKYKGTKHAIVVRYDVPLLPGARTGSDELKKALQLALKGDAQGALTVVARKDKLTIYQVKKTGDQTRELSASHLVPAQTVLKTVAFMSRVSLPVPAAPTAAG